MICNRHERSSFFNAVALNHEEGPTRRVGGVLMIGFLTSESGSGVFRSQAPVRVCSLPVQKPTTLLLSETTHDRNGAVRRIQCLCKSARNIYPFDPPVLPVSGHRSVFSMPSAKELSRQLIPQNSLILFAILPVLLLFALKIALILPFRYHLHILLFY